MVLVGKLAVSDETADGFGTWLLTIFSKFNEGLRQWLAFLFAIFRFLKGVSSEM